MIIWHINWKKKKSRYKAALPKCLAVSFVFLFVLGPLVLLCNQKTKKVPKCQTIVWPKLVIQIGGKWYN